MPEIFICESLPLCTFALLFVVDRVESVESRHFYGEWNRKLNESYRPSQLHRIQHRQIYIQMHSRISRLSNKMLQKAGGLPLLFLSTLRQTVQGNIHRKYGSLHCACLMTFLRASALQHSSLLDYSHLKGKICATCPGHVPNYTANSGQLHSIRIRVRRL